MVAMSEPKMKVIKKESLYVISKKLKQLILSNASVQMNVELANLAKDLVKVIVNLTVPVLYHM